MFANFSYMKPLQTSNYRNIVVLTGAGVSQASGIPTFRGPQGQISDAYMRVADGRNVETLLPEMWATHGAARGRLIKVAPNPAHQTLANWSNKWRDGREITVVTQNVDGLHPTGGQRKRRRNSRQSAPHSMHQQRVRFGAVHR